MEIEKESTQGATEEEIRERILREREAADAERLAHEQELEAESKQLDEEIAQEIRGMRGLCQENGILVLNVHLEMTEEEKLSIFSAPEFLDFVEQSTKIIQRALNDNYDYIRDYTIGAESGT